MAKEKVKEILGIVIKAIVAIGVSALYALILLVSLIMSGLAKIYGGIAHNVKS